MCSYFSTTIPSIIEYFRSLRAETAAFSEGELREVSDTISSKIRSVFDPFVPNRQHSPKGNCERFRHDSSKFASRRLKIVIGCRDYVNEYSINSVHHESAP